MSLTYVDGREVHFPDDPERFSFNSEVSKIFDSMALRSIPNYAEAHAAHARMLKDWVKPGARILDVGASRGAFLRALFQEYPDLNTPESAVNVHAIDNSPDMCEYLTRDFPYVYVRQEDLASPSFLYVEQAKYDVICANYVLQFSPREKQEAVLVKLMHMVRVGGVLILGHKAAHYGFSGAAAHEEYIRFRMANGYTREEIEAKTKALQNSMFPMDHAKLMRILSLHYAEVTETFRYMMFSTLFAVK